MKATQRFPASAVLLASCMLASAVCASAASTAKVPMFDGLGSHTRKITTDSREAQRYFDQGKAFLHAFNHDEAIRSFEQATELDPTCAMAWWGIALACGPHINNPAVPPHRSEQAWKAVEQARAHALKGTPVERALIDAQMERYANPVPEDRRHLDEAYAAAMRKLWQAQPKDADIGAWFAEAAMDLHPWDLWLKDGQARPWTGEIVATLEATMKLQPSHPLANHLYIHTIEASSNPGRADAAARRLRHLQPGLGHNVHMPSHIDVLLGRWQLAIDTNARAAEADRVYREKSGKPQDFYRIYMAHNHHMLAFAAMMTGQGSLAISTIRKMIAEMPEAWLRDYAIYVDGWIAMPFEVMVRFGRWDEIMAEPEPAEHFPLSRASRHEARGIALATSGRTAEARAEQAAFERERARIVPESTFGNNKSAAIAAVAADLLEGEILYREGKIEEAFSVMRRAVEAEDALAYDEPPGWIQPVRHALGASLMQSRRYAEAEAVYRADLKKWPENGWSLRGLADALRAQDRAADAASVEARFRKTWAKADVKIASSCFCQPGTSNERRAESGE